MPHIIFPEYPTVTGRVLSNGCTDPITGEYAAEVEDIRPGDTEITSQQHAAIASAAAAFVPPFEQANDPEPNGFKLAAYGYLGADAFVMPLAGYIAPVIDALNARNWTLARQIIGYALAATALTQQQYDDLNGLLADYGIPA